MFEEIARRGVARRRGVLGLTVVVAAIAAVLGSSVFDEITPFGFQDPDSESTRAYDQLEAATGERPLPGVILLVEPPTPIASAAGRRAVADASATLAGLDGIARVVAPESIGTSTDGRAALVLGFIASDEESDAVVGARVEDAFSGNATVSVGGVAVASDQLNQATERDLKRIELIAAPLLFLLSLLVFRSAVAALLPVVVGLLSTILTLFALWVLTKLTDIDSFAINIVTALGLGLAIDYSLFVVSRFREELEAAGSTEAALSKAVGAVGPMIVFSALTVAGALASLLVFPQRFLYSIGIAGALVALLSALVVIVVLPALLAVVGERINSLSLPSRDRSDRHGWYEHAWAVSRRASRTGIT